MVFCDLSRLARIMFGRTTIVIIAVIGIGQLGCETADAGADASDARVLLATKQIRTAAMEGQPTPKQALILKSYLNSSMIMLSEELKNPAVRLGLQVFILGMTDMLRQVEELSWEQFIAIYEATLSEHKLLPSMPVANFVERIGEKASSNEDIEMVMRQGAQSIQMYITENDAQAPIDLIGAAHFAEKNASSFTQIVGP